MSGEEYTCVVGRGNPLHVVTGAADGIGRALVEEFASRGYSVVGVDANRDKAAAAEASLRAKGSRAKFIVADVSRPVGRRHICDSLASLGRIATFVHNAGINRFGRFESMSADDIHHILDVNFAGPLHLTKQLLAEGRWCEKPRIAFVSSLSCFVGYPGAVVYAASKDGLASYASGLAVAGRRHGLKVLTVFPGPTRTAHARENSPDNSREHRRMPPEDLARRIARALDSGRRTLVPGFGNRVAALVGQCFPNTVSRMLARGLGIRR